MKGPARCTPSTRSLAAEYRKAKSPRAEGEEEMRKKKIEQLLPLPFLVTESELRDRKEKRRRKPNRAEAIRRLVELELKAKGK